MTAKDILLKYNSEPFHIKHVEIVSGVMRHFAKEYDPENEEMWAEAGLLNDVDFQLFPEEHCVKGEELLRCEGVDERIIRAAMSHGYGLSEPDY
ncbi:MAG: hypothetical protein LBL87_04815 [Ruminococcus sp.]|jgi:predicted hydrolase (HD superfamily)|nr:hypothetical protein [Ruminococcus sp.]